MYLYVSDDVMSKTASDQQAEPSLPQPTPDPEKIDKTAPRININPDVVKSRDSIKKSYLNAVVMGHVGCGKSTVSGRLVYECDGIDEDLMTKFEREANQVINFESSRKHAYIILIPLNPTFI